MLALTWANHFLFSHSCSEVQCLFSDRRRSKMWTLWANVLRKSEPEKFSQNIFQFNFFLTTEGCCHHVFCLPMASIEYLWAHRGSQSSNHQTVWNAQDVLITVFCFFASFSKIQITELKYLCLPGDQLDAFPTLLCPSGEQIRGQELSQENKKRGRGGHTFAYLFSWPPSLNTNKCFLSAVFFTAISTSSAQTYVTLTALHRFLTSFQLLIVLCFVWIRWARADTPHITWAVV